MKLFSLIPNNTVFYGGPSGPGFVYMEAKPEPKIGIKVQDDGTIRLGDDNISVSEELLQSSDPNAVMVKDGRLWILRASVSTGTDGKPILVPELPEDAGDALVLFGIGVNYANNLHYEADSVQVVARKEIDLGWPCFVEEIILAHMKPGQLVTAVRSVRKWVFFGQLVRWSELRLRFDGEDVVYEKSEKDRD